MNPDTNVHGVGSLADKDQQTVTSSGIRLAQVVEGVEFRPATTQLDERGSLTEILSSPEGAVEDPIVYVYTATVRPGQVKGWVVHLKQDDRLFFLAGVAKVALYDARSGSPTEGVVDVRYMGDENRGLLRIPAGVYHAVRNVGIDDVRFVNLPTRGYDHSDPDKHRLPADNDLIPYAV